MRRPAVCWGRISGRWSSCSPGVREEKGRRRILHLCINISTGGCVKHATRGPEPGRQRVQSGPHFTGEGRKAGPLTVSSSDLCSSSWHHPRSATCHSTVQQSFPGFTQEETVDFLRCLWVVFSHIHLSRLCFRSPRLLSVDLVWEFSVSRCRVFCCVCFPAYVFPVFRSFSCSLSRLVSIFSQFRSSSV